MKISKQELAKIVAEETSNYFRYKEGRLIGSGFARELINKMNDIADLVNKFDPSSIGGDAAEELNAAQQALNSALEGTFGEIATAPVSQPAPSTLGEGCGMSDEPMPLPGPPPQGFEAAADGMNAAFDDHEGRMAKAQLYKMSKYSEELMGMLNDQDQLPAWVQAKITKAADYLGAVKHHLEYQNVAPEQMNEELNKPMSLEEGKIADTLLKMADSFSDKWMNGIEKIVDKLYNKLGDNAMPGIESLFEKLGDRIVDLSNRYHTRQNAKRAAKREKETQTPLK